MKDEEDIAHQGELLIIHSWRPDIQINHDAAFTIILAQQPLTTDNPPSESNVVVCGPAVPVRLPSAVAEPAAAYGVAGEPPAPLRLSLQTLSAFADGDMLTAHPLSTSSQATFGGGVNQPQLHLLARDLLAAARRTKACWRVIDETLTMPRPMRRVADPERLRARLSAVLGRVPSGRRHSAATESITRLRKVAAGASPDAAATSPAVLADDVALVRCLAERPAEIATLLEMRAYLNGAKPARNLIVDHATTLEQLTFVSLLADPRSLDRIRSTFEFYRTEYATSYTRHHKAYWRAVAPLRAALDNATIAAQALTRLNTLLSLGKPVGRAVLNAYQRLSLERRACPGSGLASALREQPFCPDCKITLEDSPPIEQVDEVLRRLHAALSRQQVRLASEAVRRILARGGQRIEQFLQIVQASDLTGLAQVLDDELLDFLQELLADPVSPTPEALDLFIQLAHAYPTITEEQLDEVSQTLRQLLMEKLAVQQTSDSSQPAAFRLAATPPPSPS